MPRYIDADALSDELFERLCSDCEKRKGVKSGKWRIIYNVGDAPCRACEVDDMKGYLDDAPAVDAVPVVRCRECVYYNTTGCSDGFGWCEDSVVNTGTNDDFFCARGRRREDGDV